MAFSIVEAARLMWCPGLAQLNGRPVGTIHDWLKTATYAPTVSGDNLILSNISRRPLLEAFGADVNRISSAASETLRNIVEIEDLPKSSAWPHVKLYYASLFYAHAMLRIWGRSPSYFRTLELMPLRNIIRAYSITSPYKLQTGQYLLKADILRDAVYLSPANIGGGSHESVWRAFHQALSDLQVAVANSSFLTADKQNIDRLLKALAALISKNGQNIPWPSQMRNDIQYRQAEGLWYPYQGKVKTSALQKETEALINGQIDLSDLIYNTGSELKQFRYACQAIICLARSVIADMSSVGGAKSFLRHGQRKFEDAFNA